MEKKLYYIECTCIRDVKFPNTEFHIGDILYYNGNASSNEMWVFNNKAFHNVDYEHIYEMSENVNRYKGLAKSYLPFTRQKKNARKYKKLKQAEYIKRCIENRGDFNCEIKEIKITYTEEEQNVSCKKENNIEKELIKFLENVSPEELKKELNDLKEWNKVGPTVDEYVKSFKN